MIQGRRFTRLYFILAMLMAFGLHESARAQTQGESGNKAAASAAAPTESAPMQIIDLVLAFLDQVALLFRQIPDQ